MHTEQYANRVFENKIEKSEGLRYLVGALWSAILLLSFAGMLQPMTFKPVLMLQIIYKSIFLCAYLLPKVMSNGVESVPKGIFYSFLAIVLTYPYFVIAL